MGSFDKVWINARLATIGQNDKIIIHEDMFIAINDKKIAAIDTMRNFSKYKAKKTYNSNHKLITTGLIDPHTHLVYGGNRASEFEQRLRGVTYEEIAKNGGGINATINSTRKESFDTIYKSSAKRLLSLIKEGVTTIEVKTGYGLDTKTEIKILNVAKKLEENYPVHIEKTFLGAHCVPPEYKNDPDSYIDYICNSMLDEVYKLNYITAVDAYCEHLAFSTEQTQRVFDKAKSLGLPIKLHADQFSQMGATKLGCAYNALSVDHLEYCDEDSIKQMQKSGTVALLLPGAYYFLRETKTPPIDLFRKYNIPMAIATDLNPGTSALCSLQLMLNMGCVLFGLTVNEAFLAVTKHAAKALGLQDSKGLLAVGYDADLCVWDVSHPKDIIASYMPNSLAYSVQHGEIVNV